MAVFTNGGLTLLATALQSSTANAAIAYVAIGPGVGTLSTALTSGNVYSSLSLAAATTVAVAAGQQITLLDSTGDTQVITANLNASGVTTLSVQSFNAAANYPIGTGVVNTPLATDLALQNETYRIPSAIGAAGANPGESLNGAYFDPTTPTAIYLEVGYFGGSTAGAGAGTGVLVARDTVFWNHTVNVDSAFYQLDTTL